MHVRCTVGRNLESPLHISIWVYALIERLETFQFASNLHPLFYVELVGVYRLKKMFGLSHSVLWEGNTAGLKEAIRPHQITSNNASLLTFQRCRIWGGCQRNAESAGVRMTDSGWRLSVVWCWYL